ncbi:MAG TPA: hypothetical protein VKE74_16855, partial [Gemmataceae bacterium]|nr:hypothetical protein [Gemmataceae bacterium]
MAGWTTRRTAAGTLGLFAVAALSWAVSVRAQPPAPFPTAPSTPLAPQTDGEKLPPLVVEDPNVQPAQLTRPAGPAPGAPGPTSPARPVADPPAPLVRIQVRVAADAAPGDDVSYVITITNTSQADAHAVTVRNPIPEGAAEAVKAEPKPDEKLSTPQQLVWSFGTLKPGQTKTIELVLKPKPDAKEMKNLAYVKFEHGEQVVTRINKPALKVTKSAPKQTVRDEPYLVRVVVENTGKVPAENIRVVENVDRSAEVEAVTAGSKRTKPDENQWQWEFAKLMPGERKVIEYRITPKQAADAMSTTHVEAGKGVLEKAEARTQVLVPGLSVKLTGPTGVVAPGDAAKYEITIRNTGTLPSTNVRVAGSIPADCKPTMKTDGGQVYRDQIFWTVPKLEPGEAMTFRFALKANTTGRRVVVASATDARKLRAAEELATVFQGTAALVWETVPDPVALSVGR